jgi:hypothetical protein
MSIRCKKSKDFCNGYLKFLLMILPLNHFAFFVLVAARVRGEMLKNDGEKYALCPWNDVFTFPAVLCRPIQ